MANKACNEVVTVANMPMTVFDMISAMQNKYADRVAFRYVEGKDRVVEKTYAQYVQDIRKATGYLQQELGEPKGKKIVILSRTNYEYGAVVFGTMMAGAVIVTLNQGKTWAELEHELDMVEPDLIFNDGIDYGYRAQLEALYGARLRPMDAWTAAPEAEMVNRIDHEGLLMLMFTSGTTGYPKIATHSHKYGLGHFLTAKYWQNVDPNGLHFTISDTGWGKALWGKLYGQWMNEAPVFTYDFDRFDANKILPMFAKYHITTFCAPPTMFRFFIKEDLSKFDLSSLKYAVVAGEALNPEVYNRFLEATGIKLMEGFGQTETTLSIANFVGDSNKVGSMGRPSPLYDIDIVLPDGTPAKPGETGEIVIRTDKKVPCGLYLGYYNNEEKTKEAWHDGAYHTGDTAWRDEDGYFWYVGRVDDLIKSSGYRIGPFEIESVIMELPYVLECAITAAPDEIRGQVVKASIVLTKGTEASETLKKEIQNYVKEHTAPYKYPRIVEFMEELPKTISGKIRRVALRENSEKQK